MSATGDTGSADCSDYAAIAPWPLNTAAASSPGKHRSGFAGSTLVPRLCG